MKTSSVNWLNALLLVCAIVILGSCDDEEPMGKGDIDFEITDAPIDDATVKGVFVTIADVKVDGMSIPGFSKQTIDLAAYQEGKTTLLASAQKLNAKTYTNLVLVLDLDTDANGNAPGCYVLSNDDTKYKLRSSVSGTMDLKINKPWSVTTNKKSTAILDVDLRKSIRYMDDQAVKYDFVSNAELTGAIRVVPKDKVGNIKGTYEETQLSNADKIIVYAYKKGTFDEATETHAQGEGQVFFANAATSAEVKQGISGKTFLLALLESGDYELHFASYTMNETSGHLAFQTLLDAKTSIMGIVGASITVEPGTTLNVSTTIDVL